MRVVSFPDYIAEADGSLAKLAERVGRPASTISHIKRTGRASADDAALLIAASHDVPANGDGVLSLECFLSPKGRARLRQFQRKKLAS